MAIDDLLARDWVLLPGTLCTADVFGPILTELGVPEDRRRAVNLDRPAVEAYQELCALCEGAVVCGFSLGAIVAAHYADRMKAARCVFFGINPLPDDPTKATGRRAMAQDVIALGGAQALESRVPPLLGPRPEAARATILQMAGATSCWIEAQTDLALSRPGALLALSRAMCPIFTLTGSDDAMTPPDLGQQAAEAAPTGQFHRLDGLGHYALLEDPKICAEALHQMEAAFDQSA